MKTVRSLAILLSLMTRYTILLAQQPIPPALPPPGPEVEQIFKVVEQMPYFPGCEERGGLAERKACGDSLLLKFIYDNLIYPPLAQAQRIEGTVVVSFVVDKDGSVRDIQLLRDIGGGCGEEAVRIVNLMVEQQIRWVTRTSRSRPVAVQFTLPVRFRLER